MSDQRTEIRANDLEVGDVFVEFGDGEEETVADRSDHGDRVLVSTVAGHERSFDVDEVIERVGHVTVDPADDDGFAVGVDLLASLIEANATRTQALTNGLLQSQERQTRFFAGELLRLIDHISAMPEMVRTVALDRILDNAEGARMSAERTMRSEPLHGDRDPHEYQRPMEAY